MGKHDQGAGRDEAEATAGEVARRCSLCRGEIPSEFYLLRGLLVCPSCGEAIDKRQQGRGKLRRGLLFGVMAASLCGLLWHLGTMASGRPLVPLAVLAGIAIGLAIHQGSGGHGGWRYQLAAVLLVYATFVGRYVPPVFGGMADAIKKEHQQVAGPATPAAEATATRSATPAAGTSIWATVKAYFVFTLVAWGLVLAAPFMPATASWLGLASLALGMALAFRFNRTVRIHGPFVAT